VGTTKRQTVGAHNMLLKELNNFVIVVQREFIVHDNIFDIIETIFRKMKMFYNDFGNFKQLVTY
jgi:hypothetical protein